MSDEEQGRVIRFIDPDTGRYYKVAETKAAVDAAWKLGFIPATDHDLQVAEKVDRRAA